MNRISVSTMAQIGVIAAVYAALTIVLAPLSYGAVQIRIAEALMLLCVARKRWCVALTIGCLIANLFSSMAIDILVGTAATMIAAVVIHWVKRPAIAAVIPALVNGLLVGWELNVFMEVPFWYAFGTVALGELIAVAAIGLPLYYAAMRSPYLRRWIAAADATVS